MILKDKVSVVTGGGQGLGRAIAIELAKRESSVAVSVMCSRPTISLKGGFNLAAQDIIE